MSVSVENVQLTAGDTHTPGCPQEHALGVKGPPDSFGCRLTFANSSRPPDALGN